MNQRCKAAAKNRWSGGYENTRIGLGVSYGESGLYQEAIEAYKQASLGNLTIQRPITSALLTENQAFIKSRLSHINNDSDWANDAAAHLTLVLPTESGMFREYKSVQACHSAAAEQGNGSAAP